MSVRAALAVFVLFLATVEAGEGGVEFWRTEVTLTCPGEGTFYKKDKTNVTYALTDKHEFKYENGKKGFYYCKYDKDDPQDSDPKETYHFYVQGKVCPNCFELDGALLLMVLIGDVVMTVCVMVIIFKCTKKKGPAGPAHTSSAPVRQRPGPSNSHSSTYQELSPNTRQDTYSTVNRMG